MSLSDRTHPLSWGDTFFLYLEREGQPINIASCCEFEGKLTRQACARFVESKLHLIPRYQQRAVFPSFNLGLPQWELDPEFDINNHVREVVLKQVTDRDLKIQTAKVVSSHLDRKHPLWDITLVRGAKGNRTGVIFRVHHSMADGVSGVGIMKVLFDASPNPEKPAPKKKQPTSPHPTDSVALLLDQLLKSYQSFMQGALTAQNEVLNIAHEVLASATHGLTEDLIHLVPELASPAERFPFNQICRGPQHLAWGEIPMAEIKAIREACGGTMNDVVLTAITSTVRRYAEQHGVNVRGRELRMIVPVNVRGDGDITELGNKITFLPINLPLDVRDPRAMISRISERIVFLRSVGVPEIVGVFGMLVSKVPLPVQAALVPLLTQLPLSLANMICTNVPGPQFPLYLMGHKLLRCYPYVPIGGLLGVNVAILSYNGVAYVGFGGDVFAVPDIDRFEEMLRESFAELRAAALQPAAAQADPKPTTNATRSRTIPVAPAQSKSKPPRPRVKLKTIPVSPAPQLKQRKKAARKTVPFRPAAKPVAASAQPPVHEFAQTGD
ncbi:MAG TPA: wax ester/triacylglycerol synthase family O-acyltransferase [Candidatus Angelobacter sp.]|nr:wax ester/triacylglycerol synthase family O-acyltransferase [Candidatus Angelobacter sp.]